MKRGEIIRIESDKNVKWIYESPDGKIVYRRKLGTKKREIWK
jgi:hypothetical protein